jgi:hypothetical protein
MDAPVATSLAYVDALGIGNRLVSALPRDGPFPGVHDGIAAAIGTLTLDKYARDFALFGYWVIANHPMNVIVPTHLALIGMYIGDLLHQGLSKGRVLGRIAAVQFANEVSLTRFGRQVVKPLVPSVFSFSFS